MSPKLNELTHLIMDMQGLENELHIYERKYHLRSADFYRLASADQIEQTPEFIIWLGTYQVWLKREKKYQRLLKSELTPIIKSLNREARNAKIAA